MKKLLIGCMIIGLLFTGAEAKKNKIFDLKDQYFSGTLIKKGQEGFAIEQRYDIGKAFVTTDTRFNGYSYVSGIFTVDIKEPLEEWSVNIKKKNGARNASTTIRLTSDTGKSYYIVYQSDFDGICRGSGAIQVNSKIFKVKCHDIVNQVFTSSVVDYNDKVTFSVNGSVLLRTEKKDFGNLEKVEVELNNNYNLDELFALDIYEVK